MAYVAQPKVWRVSAPDDIRVHMSNAVAITYRGFVGRTFCDLPITETIAGYEDRAGNPADNRPVNCGTCRGVAERLARLIAWELAGAEGDMPWN